MKIKVCGLKYLENMQAVADLKPDYIGMICYSKSPRYIDGANIEAVKTLPTTIQRVAVFVNEDIDEVVKLIDELGLSAVQLHGNESPEYCQALLKKVVVIKAFGIHESFDFEKLEVYKDVVDYFLFDAKTPIHGGSGLTFNWQLLDRYKLDVPFFVSGGIGPDNLEEVLGILHPQFYGVDLNSKFETAPALKDIEKLKKAFQTIKELHKDEVRS